MSNTALPIPKERNLYLSSQVNQTSILELSKQIIEINKDDSEIKRIYKIFNLKYKPNPIKIYIDSYGGAVYQCFGLLGIIKTSKTKIHTIVTGCAMSCGFLISISGHKRFAYEKSTFLYHQLSSVEYGKLKEIEDSIIESKRLQKMIENHVLENTKISKNRLKESYKSKEDWFIPIENSLELGIVDKII